MNILEILNNYENTADQTLALLLEERASLKEGRSIDDTSDRKRVLIQQLTELVDQIRVYRESGPEDLSFVKDRLAYVQQRLMKILQLDREVEKLFLGNSLRPNVPDLVPHASRVGKAYQSTGSRS